MLKSLQIDSFRGFRKLQIEPLRRVNLVTGENDTGKTGLLEALYLLLLSNANQIGAFSSAFRSSQRNSEDDFRGFWEWLFFEKNTKLKPLIRAKPTEGTDMTCQLVYAGPPHEHVQIYQDAETNQPQPKFNVAPGSYGGGNTTRLKILIQSTHLGEPVNDAELYNRVSLTASGEERILELMRVVEPRLQKLRYSKITNQPLVYAHLGFAHFLPATQMGQGFSRLLTLFCEMMVSEAKVLLIDEIENGIHYSVLTEIWKGISALAESEDIQVFATTHSWGCIVAAHEAFAATDGYDFALHRLQRVKGDVEAITYDREMLETSLKGELEVR